MQNLYAVDFCSDLTLLLKKDETKIRYESGYILKMEVIDKKELINE